MIVVKVKSTDPVQGVSNSLLSSGYIVDGKVVGILAPISGATYYNNVGNYYEFPFDNIDDACIFRAKNGNLIFL